VTDSAVPIILVGKYFVRSVRLDLIKKDNVKNW